MIPPITMWKTSECHWTGLEMWFFVNSPHKQDINVVWRADGSGSQWMGRVKLLYLRDYHDLCL